MVSPLSATPWAHASRRDDECCDVLERYAYHHPVSNKVLQGLPNQQETDTQIRASTPKSVISNPWECLCVDPIGPYTLKGRDNSQIDFMAVTMIDPASSWFEIVELPLVKRPKTHSVNGKELLQAEDVFDKSSNRIAKLVNKTWLCRYPRCRTLIYDNGSEFKFRS